MSKQKICTRGFCINEYCKNTIKTIGENCPFDKQNLYSAMQMIENIETLDNQEAELEVQKK